MQFLTYSGVVVITPGASCMLGKHSTPELQPQPNAHFWKVIVVMASLASKPQHST